MTTQTYFASAKRASNESVSRDVDLFQQHSLIQQLYDALNTIVLILNQQRQIVFVNRALLNLFDEDTSARFLAKRPGEAFNCMHAAEINGCGTTRFCRECGAVKAIMTSQKENRQEVQDCRILRGNGQDALNLRVCATPLPVDDQIFTVFSIEDTSDSERRKSLERIFFHDIMNTAVGVRGLGELLTVADINEVPEYTEQIYKGADTLVQEIESQRDLLAIENKELNVILEPVQVSGVVSNIQAVYQNHDVAQGKVFCVEQPPSDLYVKSDRALLERVIGNMVKNALEASLAGDSVTLTTHTDGDHVVFVVQNPGIIPEAIQLQLFQRSFSTKGTGRGLGTYSMKLISERYLNGSVSFLSNEKKGTEFYAIIPADQSPETTSAMSSSIGTGGPLPLSVLIVEDVPVNMKIVKHMLANRVRHLDTATNGHEAVTAAETGNFDVILMDIDLPDMTGIEASEQIIDSCKNRNRSIPKIIGLTAHRLVGDTERCFKAGMCSYLTKPVGKEELLRALSERCI